jgi:GNAT superfamily N-acetyltransferase
MLIINGKEVLASKGGDAYVDPDFRRQGIAQALHHQGITDMQQLGIACNFGISPVPANYRAFIRAGALSPGTFDRYRLPLDATWIAKRLGAGWIHSAARRILDPLVHYYAERRIVRRGTLRENLQVVKAFDTRASELFDSVSHLYGISGKRDLEYLDWRFTNHPFNDYTLIECISSDELFGYAVLDMQSDRCKIVDFVARDDGVGTSNFLILLAKFARELGKKTISLRLNPIGAYATVFQRNGFVRANADLPMMVLTIGSKDLDDVFSNPENWFLMPGDQDTA